MKTALLSLFLVTNSLIAAPSISPATQAINGLGIDLLHVNKNTNANLLLSPYSIQSALAMTYAGAAGVTRDEMKRALHFSDNTTALHDSFAQLQTQFAEQVAASTKSLEAGKKYQASFTPLSLNVANRLYAQRGYEFKANFFDLLKKKYNTSLEQVDFKKNAPAITTDINQWVEQQTQQRIRDLIPPTALNEDARLVLVNALYFKAAWEKTFSKNATRPEPFNISDESSKEVPTMMQQAKFGYGKFPGGQMIAMPYRGVDFQFVILLPDDTNGLAALRSNLTPDLLQQCATLKTQDVILHLPKFKFEPPTMNLSADLKALGMKTAFDQPRGSADFSEMAIRRPDDYLYISEVFHKTFIAVDEQGTEAAAATAVAIMVGRAAMAPSPKPVEIKVDHPFLFAIQHRPSGSCLFLGQVVDPGGK